MEDGYFSVDWPCGQCRIYLLVYILLYDIDGDMCVPVAGVDIHARWAVDN